MRLCKDCANRGKKKNCQIHTSVGNYAERCKDFKQRRDNLNSIKAAIKKLTGHEVKYIFSFNLTMGGFIDYGTGDKTYSIEFERIKDLNGV